jgi:hypothetical protein
MLSLMMFPLPVSDDLALVLRNDLKEALQVRVVAALAGPVALLVKAVAVTAELDNEPLGVLLHVTSVHVLHVEREAETATEYVHGAALKAASACAWQLHPIEGSIVDAHGMNVEAHQFSASFAAIVAAIQ